MERLSTFVLIWIVYLVFGFSACTKDSNFSQKDYFQEDWESISNYTIPEWYLDAKLGIFIHWGPYCVPEYGSEWYPRMMYMDKQTLGADGRVVSNESSKVYQHHVKYWGAPGKFGYKDFVPIFTGEEFDANAWMELFKNAGAKYVVAVAEHHDGFAMYKSKHTRWNAMDMGPKRDIINELSGSARQYGLKFGASSHFAFNWDYYIHKKGFDTMDPKYFDLYGVPNDKGMPPTEEFVDLWWRRTKDIIDNYPLDILWFDYYWRNSAFEKYHKKVPAYFYNTGLKKHREVVLQCKNNMRNIFPEGAVVFDIERGIFTDTKKSPWQTDTSIGKNSWGYVKNWETKSANILIDNLVDIVSKNGSLLLNIGPQKDGTIPGSQVEMLLEIGNWLSINGDAIYGTRPWKISGEGSAGHQDKVLSDSQSNYTSEDFRFTSKNDKLYAISLVWPEDKKYVINSLGSNSEYLEDEIASIKLLGYNEEIEWNQLSDLLIIELPYKQPTPFAHTFEIAFN